MNNKTLTILTLALAFLGGFLFFYRGGSTKQAVPVANQANQQTNTKQNFESKTDDQASVTVTITPSDLDVESEEWKFDVVISTHSVELDQDMTKIAVLIDDSDNEYSPVRWKGAPAGGHHREGTLIFASIAPYPQDLKLNIKNIGDVQRLFSWILVK